MSNKHNDAYNAFISAMLYSQNMKAHHYDNAVLYSTLFSQKYEKDVPHSSSDNICAISMLTSLTGILDAIEHDNAVEIDKCLIGLKRTSRLSKTCSTTI